MCTKDLRQFLVYAARSRKPRVLWCTATYLLPAAKFKTDSIISLLPDKALVHALSHDSSGMKGPSHHLRFRPEAKVKAELDSSSFSLPAVPHCLSIG